MATDLVIRIRADGTAKVVSEVAQLNKEISQLNKQSGDSAAGVAKVSDQVGDLSSKVSAIGGIGAALVVAPAVIGSVAALASAYKDAQLQASKLQKTYEFSFGGAAGGAQNLTYVRDTANALGTELLSTAEAYGKLSAASVGTNLQGEKTRGIFEAVSKASTVLGLSAADTSGALTAIQQMMSKGTVSSEELRGQLGERLPGAFQIAARAVGVTTSELGKMLEQGKVLTDDFLPKFADEIEKTFGASAEKAANSLQAQLNRMDNAWNTFKMNLSQDGEGNGGLFNWMADSLNNAAANMDRLAKKGDGFFKRFFYGLGSVEMDAVMALLGGKPLSGDGVTRDQKWITGKLNEISRLKTEGEGEVLKDRYSKTSQARMVQRELDDALAANAARDKAKYGAKNADGSFVNPLVDKSDLADAAAEQQGKMRSDRQKLYGEFGAEAASRNAKLKRQMDLDSFDEKFKGMKSDNPAYFESERKRLVDKLDEAVAKEGRKASGPKYNPDQYRSEQMRINQQQAAQEAQDLREAEQQERARSRAKAVMDSTVGNLSDKYQQQNAIYNERQMGEPERRLAEALRKVEEAADAAREALSAKAATLNDDAVSLEAFRQAMVQVSEAEADQLDTIKALQEEQEKLNGLWQTGASRALSKYLDAGRSVAAQTEEAFSRAFGGMEDALMNFLTTGKLNFADFAKSLIADMARIQLKALLTSQEKGGGGLGGMVGSIVKGIGGLIGVGSGVGGNLAATLNGYETMDHAALAGMFFDAKGGAYGPGGRIERFASGGVVTQPTMFRFARGGSFGLGVMGEAGSEAVMPLTRDRSGRLGVRSQGSGGGPVSIVVHVNGARGNVGEVRQAAGQGARDALRALSGANQYG